MELKIKYEKIEDKWKCFVIKHKINFEKAIWGESKIKSKNKQRKERFRIY